ncbi:Mercuric resistance operon regulatory protein [Kingella potus]|uniref:Mercuric resistance operon regulatory protein n=1 Tax=Kingella potus TaxID=265175 RepID=A0A377R0S8_9NEIS|nr:MerR family DNA-binding protein [Kingella potus]UOP00415.1 MerR family DNA-binding protein [Kingella potus]STR02518.1 Mercuric resistance operon regulatory protein [Kingella potus]
MKRMKINELSKKSGVNAETIRYYERCGLFSAERDSNGYRSFGAAELARLNFIRSCRSLGFSLDEIKQLQALKEQPAQSCQDADELVARHLSLIADKIAELQKIQAFLHNLSECGERQSKDCKVIKGLDEKASQ